MADITEGSVATRTRDNSWVVPAFLLVFAAGLITIPAVDVVLSRIERHQLNEEMRKENALDFRPADEPDKDGFRMLRFHRPGDLSPGWDEARWSDVAIERWQIENIRHGLRLRECSRPSPDERLCKVIKDEHVRF